MPTPFLLLLLPGLLSGQVVRGVVSDPASRAPVAGAMVLLVTTGDQAVARVLTAEAGHFVLRSPTPGRFRLRVDRIGYASVLTDPFDVGVGQTIERDVETGVQPVALDGFDVEGARRCEVRPAEGLATARVWEEARKALAAASWTAEREMYRFAWRRFVRELAPDGRRVLDERRTLGRGYTRQPFVAVRGEQLAEGGFVGEDGDDRIYYAPDANVLLSDAFLDTHCFALEQNRAAEELIGLRFEPVRHRRLPEVEGVVWLERAGARLRSVDYAYVNLGRVLEGDDASGELRFQELPNGSWIVEAWRIRMPRVEELRGGPYGTGSRYRVLGYKDEGGEVRRIVTATGEVVRAAGADAGISGLVVDSLGGPVAGARVWLAGTDREVSTDASGAFVFDDVGPGRWQVGASHDALDAVGHAGAFSDSEVDTSTVGGVVLRLPSVGRTVLARCEAPPAKEEGVVFGFVVDDGGSPAAGVSVHTMWTEVRRLAAPNALRISERGLGVETDVRGLFVACGVPMGVPVTVTGTRSGRTSGGEKARLTVDDPMAVVRIALPPAPPRGDEAGDGAPGRGPAPAAPAEAAEAAETDAEARWLAQSGFPLRAEEALLHQSGEEVRSRGLNTIARILEQVAQVEARRLLSGANELRFHASDGWRRDATDDAVCVLGLYLNGNRVRAGAGDPDLSPDRVLDLRLRGLSAVEVFDAARAPVAADGGCGVALLWFHRMQEHGVDFEGRLSGRVVVGADDAPAAGVLVTVEPGGHSFRTDERGRFDFGRMPPARYRLGATIPEWGSWASTVRLRAGDDQELTIRVETRRPAG